MDIDVQDRKSELEGLNIFINHISTKMQSILDGLAWDAEYLTKDKREIRVCPLDKTHLMPAESLKRHMHECSWRKEGYSNDIPLSEPSHSRATVLIDKNMQELVIHEAAMQNSAFQLANIVLLKMFVRFQNHRIDYYQILQWMNDWPFIIMRFQRQKSPLRNQAILMFLYHLPRQVKKVKPSMKYWQRKETLNAVELNTRVYIQNARVK